MVSFSVLLLLALNCNGMMQRNAVLFSSSSDEEQAIESLSKSSRSLALGISDFSLPKFNTFLQAYSKEPMNNAFTDSIRKLKFKNTITIEEPFQVPPAVESVKEQKFSNGLTYVKLKSVEDLEKFSRKTQLDQFNAVVISSTDAFSENKVRWKRVSSDVNFDEDAVEELANRNGKISGDSNQISRNEKAASTNSFQLPVVLPPYYVDSVSPKPPNGLCLFYMEAVEIVVFNKGGGSSMGRSLIVNDNGGKNKFEWNQNFVNCSVNNATIGTASFEIDINVGEDMPSLAFQSSSVDFTLPKGKLSFMLNFNGVQKTGYWSLSRIQLLDDLIVKKGTSSFIDQDLNVKKGATLDTSMGIFSNYQYSFACSQTPAAFFKTADSKIFIGIGLNNVQVDLKVLNNAQKFSWLVNDCVGTFSIGSWMGIITAVIFASILIFGYLMVQSIQTIDRFDDPKQKQLIINFKE